MENKQFEMGSLSEKILIETVGFFERTLVFLSCLASDPLFSIVVSLYSLILLYFPRIFLDLVFSPVLISIGILLSTLLLFGSIGRIEKENFAAATSEIDSQDEELNWVSCETEMGFDSKSFFDDSFVEWDVRAPLEVIYEEEYEGDDVEEDNSTENEETRQVGIDGLESLSLHYPEFDTESSSDGDFPAIEEWELPENMCFRWDAKDSREGLIEVPLDGKRSSVFQVEVENLMEIEISEFGASPEIESFWGSSDLINRD